MGGRFGARFFMLGNGNALCEMMRKMMEVKYGTYSI